MINFDIILNTNIYVYDTTVVDVYSSYTIDNMTMNVTCNRNSINKTFDCKAHILSPERESYEIQVIKPSDFNTTAFKDGLYSFTYTLNATSKTNKYILFPVVQAKFDEVVATYNYNVTVGTYNIEFAGANADTKTEQINIANALLSELKAVNIAIVTETEVNAILTKLERILEIINN